MSYLDRIRANKLLIHHITNWVNIYDCANITILCIDGQRFRVRSDGTVKGKTVYTVLAIDLEGSKDLLGLWMSETESAKYWLEHYGILDTWWLAGAVSFRTYC